MTAAESATLPARRNPTLRIAGIAGIALLAIGAAYGVYSLLHRAHPMPFENFSIKQISKNGKSVAAAISPDGKYVLSVVDDKGQSSLWLRHLPTDSDTQIVTPSDAIYFGPIFAPDGNFIYFLKRESEDLRCLLTPSRKKVTHADGDVRVGSLVRAKAKDLFQMLNSQIVLASPQPDVAAHVPPTRITGV